MDIEKKNRLSIHRFIEIAANGGDLISGFFSQKRAVDGIKGHQKVQTGRAEGYESEIPLKKEFHQEPFVLTLEGRVDGAIFQEGRWTIEEIKTLEGDFPDRWENTPILHRAQLLCYGALWDYEGDTIQLDLCYFHLQSEEKRVFSKVFSALELEEYLQACLHRYFRSKIEYSRHIEERDRSARNLSFPFSDFRQGQRLFSVEVFRAIKNGETLFCQAPTGVGKTMGTIFPGIKAWGEKLTQKILYLTAKTSGRESVRTAMKILEERGLEAKTVILTSKEKICQSPLSSRCHGQDCPFAESYFDKLEAVRGEFQEKNIWGKEEFEELSRKYTICPFELSLEWGLQADLLVGDFNHLFDPVVSLKRYFMQEEPITLLLDEAHNLPDRGRGLYSAELDKAEILGIRREVKEQDPALTKALSSLNTTFLKLKKEHEGEEKTLLDKIPPALISGLKRILDKGDTFLRTDSLFGEFSKFYFSCRFFLQIAELMGEGHRVVFTSRKKSAQLALVCLDASEYLRESLTKCSSSIFFSATLEPLSYFKESILGSVEYRDYIIPSPFPQEHCRILVRSDIDTRFKAREISLPEAISAIRCLWREYPGHQMAFFPSYRYMEQAAELWKQQYPEEITQQSRNMSDDEKTRLLGSLEKKEPVLLFAVLGGVFSEGIDLRGDRLIALSILSVGLPAISFEGDLLKKYYDERGGKGYLYSSCYPGWNRILQASGRLIRSEKDRGLILLLGKRFCQPFYRSLRPAHWRNLKEVDQEHKQKQEIELFRGTGD